MTWHAVIGIEVHVQLRTVTKMFCPCAIPAEGDLPNSKTCPTCLGLPGALPVPNKAAIEKVLAVGAAIGAAAPGTTIWDRKNYFYPDLPKGYQISQLDFPLAAHGAIEVTTSAGTSRVRIRRAHLEEDTARLRHEKGSDGKRSSLIDYNRSGVALLEIVTEPDIRDAETARRYAEELRLLLRTIGAADAEMENGQMRVEANVSIRSSEDAPFGTRTEVKNMNSFRSVEKAIAFEIARQAEILEAGGSITQETRGWDESSETTYTMRAKENSHDYRYFPEPDLPPLTIEPTWLASIVSNAPEIPSARRARYVEQLALSDYDAAVLVGEPRAAALFEAARAADPSIDAKSLANWVTGEYLRAANEGAAEPDPAQFAALIGAVSRKEINGTTGKELFAELLGGSFDVRAAISERGLGQISDDAALKKLAIEVLAANPQALADWKAGKQQAIGFLVGQAMKASKGRGDAAQLGVVFKALLDA
ncbi:MAG: Asp-tRNA(Asn)/Glu-tRNA(Gln) amidotransferase subunit GatB [Candidatus Limnocylindrus sp.]|jgi:aspartyl-tRNA(Asn)/glutamyl-tRNA(Gln) amidotransferase subunit B